MIVIEIKITLQTNIEKCIDLSRTLFLLCARSFAIKSDSAINQVLDRICELNKWRCGGHIDKVSAVPRERRALFLLTSTFPLKNVGKRRLNA